MYRFTADMLGTFAHNNISIIKIFIHMQLMIYIYIYIYIINYKNNEILTIIFFRNKYQEQYGSI